MKKKAIILTLFLILIISLTGCSKKEETTQAEKEKSIINFLTNYTLTTSTQQDNFFYIFTKDGKYVRHHGAKPKKDKTSYLVMDTGTYEIKDNTLIINIQKQFINNYNSNTKTYKLSKLGVTQTEKYPNIEIKTIEDNQTVLEAQRLPRLSIIKENVPNELIQYIKGLINDNIDNYDIEKAKSYEYKKEDN